MVGHTSTRGMLGSIALALLAFLVYVVTR